MPTLPFHAAVPLKPGITVVEASAGTGKTFGITTLVVRFVAEQDIPIEKILVVTFTRAATAELKQRIHSRLADAVLALRDPQAIVDPDLQNIVGRLRSQGREEKARRNLEMALASLDAASISTIHGFCQRMLQVNAFESGVDLGLELVPEAYALLEEMVDDYLVKTLYDADPFQVRFLQQSCGITREALGKIARQVAEDPDMEILPQGEFLPRFQAWKCAVERFRSQWEEHREDGLAKLRQAVSEKVLNRGSYKLAKIAENAALVEDWMQGGRPLRRSSKPKPPRSLVEYFSSSRLQAKVNKGKVLNSVDHPLFRACEAMLLASPPEISLPRADFARWIRGEMEARKQALGLQTYQDLLRTLARAIGGDPASPLAQAIRARYQVALIDEFQDTDTVQWSIFSHVFGGGDRHLYLIGDPKQAIYGFRGANVHVYLDACKHANRILTLETNWRSDASFTRVMNASLEQPGFFGLPGIDYRQVQTPASRNPPDQFLPPEGAPREIAAPLQIRFLDARLQGKDPGPMNLYNSTQLIAEAVAEEVVEFLESGSSIFQSGAPPRPVGAGDLAVLVSKNHQARTVLEAMRMRGVPAVIGNTGSVYESPEALHLLRWLEAVARPRAGRVARTAASSSLFGWDAEALLNSMESETPVWIEWLNQLVSWQKHLHRFGFMATFRRMLEEQDVPLRLLALPGGERRLTNLLHLGELAHEASRRQSLGLPGLIQWLQGRIKTAAEEGAHGGGEDPSLMRLDRDDAALRVVTVHKAKGLEYPFIWIPFLGEPSTLTRTKREAGVLVAASQNDPCQRTLHLQLPGEIQEEILNQVEAESLRERLRLLYVALTRARHRCVLYWGAFPKSASSPLAVFFHGHPDPENPELSPLARASARVEALAPEALQDQVEALTDRLGEGAGFQVCSPPGRHIWQGSGEPIPELQRRLLQRPQLDRLWGTSSFTSLVRRADGDPTRPWVDVDLLPEAPPQAVPLEPGPLEAFPAGAKAGIFLHAVLEETDFQAPENSPRCLRTVLENQLPAHGFQPPELVEEALLPGLQLALETPLGGPLGDFKLADLSLPDRLDELRFQLPIAGGSRWGGEGFQTPLLWRKISRAFELRPGDPVMRPETIESLAEMQFGNPGLAGFLTGSIDLVFRVVQGKTQRWFLVDYKSNRLPNYSFEDLRDSMEQHHYYLQYHLYTLALHRFLQARMGTDYDYQSHFGGVAYLFLRGMVGAPESGVFFDRPPLAVLKALDRAFQGSSSVSVPESCCEGLS
jgi:exodeoxyribonuclease V beta subunit